MHSMACMHVCTHTCARAGATHTRTRTPLKKQNDSLAKVQAYSSRMLPICVGVGRGVQQWRLQGDRSALKEKKSILLLPISSSDTARFHPECGLIIWDWATLLIMKPQGLGSRHGDRHEVREVSTWTHWQAKAAVSKGCEGHRSWWPCLLLSTAY